MSALGFMIFSVITPSIKMARVNKRFEEWLKKRRVLITPT
jgi:hypothetical protein